MTNKEIIQYTTSSSSVLFTQAPIRVCLDGTIIDSCCCCLHIKSRSDLYSVLSNIRTGPTDDADAFRGHRLTTQNGYTYQKEIKGPRKKVNTHAII